MISFDEEVMHIAGSLLPANTGCVKWLEKQSEEALHMDRLVLICTLFFTYHCDPHLLLRILLFFSSGMIINEGK